LWFGTNEESVVEVVEVILALERRVTPAMIWMAAAGVPIDEEGWQGYQTRADAGATLEGVLHGADGEQNKPYNRRQGPHHQPVRPRVLQAEEVGEAHCNNPPEDQH
jgi:hypothetical protein